MILEYGQPRSGLQLLIIESKEISLGLFDLVDHILP